MYTTWMPGDEIRFAWTLVPRCQRPDMPLRHEADGVLHDDQKHGRVRVWWGSGGRMKGSGLDRG